MNHPRCVQDNMSKEQVQISENKTSIFRYLFIIII